jgi:hypothetical protein
MIETLDDWNDKLEQCGCCFMPECPAPIVVCEYKSAITWGDEVNDEIEYGENETSVFRFPYASPGGVSGDDLPFIYRKFHSDPEVYTYNGFQKYYYFHSYLAINPDTDVEGLWTTETAREIFWTGDDEATGTECFSNKEESTGEGESDCGPCVAQMSWVIREWQTGGFESWLLFPEYSGVVEDPTEVVSWDCATTVRTRTGTFHWNGEYSAETVPSATLLPGVGPWGAPVSPDPALEIHGFDFTVEVEQIETLSEPISKAGFLAFTAEKMEAESWTPTSLLSPCVAKHVSDWPVIPDEWPECEFADAEASANAYLKKLRFRFRIPDTHTGSKYYITYDIAEFPDDGAPSLVSEDNVVEWTGPGTGASSDPSWLTDWVVIEPPEVSGERRIVNIRYTCYSGAKYGAKPQLVGEAFP